MSAPVQGGVFKDGTATLLARVVGHEATPITIATILSAKYSITTVDDDSAVAGHQEVSVEPSSLLYNTLQVDDLWGDIDSVGYNFKWLIDISTHPAFAVRGIKYRVQWVLTTATQPIVFDFVVNVV